MFDSIKNEISNLSKSKILIDEPLKKHTTFGVGGKASIFIYPSNFENHKKWLNSNGFNLE